MQLMSEHIDDTLIVKVQAARIDSAAAIKFKDSMRELIGGGYKRVLLDLSDVEFIDSSGLGAIVAVRKLLGQEGGMELSSLTPDVAKVFKLTHMNRVFTIHEDGCEHASSSQSCQ